MRAIRGAFGIATPRREQLATQIVHRLARAPVHAAIDPLQPCVSPHTPIPQSLGTSQHTAAANLPNAAPRRAAHNSPLTRIAPRRPALPKAPRPSDTPSAVIGQTRRRPSL
eukprot:7160360-Prymnesium_polylepis.1